MPQKRDKSQDKAVAHDVSIPTGIKGGPVSVRDLYGKAVQAKVADGAVTLNLSASPQYIALSAKPEGK